MKIFSCGLFSSLAANTQSLKKKYFICQNLSLKKFSYFSKTTIPVKARNLNIPRAFLLTSNKTFFSLVKFQTTLNHSVKSPSNIKEKFNLFQISKKYMRSAKTKLKLKYPNKKYKMKTKKGLAKRIHIVGKLFDRGFKFKAPGHVHKMTNKSANNLRRKKKARYIAKTDIKHIYRQLPYFRRRRYKR